MTHFLTRLGLWIARLGNWPSEAVLVRTRHLCAAQAPHSDLSGEYKRHQVYAQLIKEFPGTRKRTLGLAIELSLSA